MGRYFVAVDMLRQTYRRALGAVAALLLAAWAGAGCGGDNQIILATTTSARDSGLLDILVPAFEEESGYSVAVIAVGSGQALEMARRGDADVVLAHAPSSEEKLEAEGVVMNRRLVMHNDFVVVGPEGDPAGAADAPDVLAALEAIADAAAPFFSRGDDSGTHQLERALWGELGFDPTGEDWYQETGTGMGETLQIANQREGYTIADRATYLVQRERLDLVIVHESDARLRNVYHVMQVNPDRFDRVNAAGAQAFVAFLVSPEAQRLIGDFGVEQFGEPLFIPDASKTGD